ncbi:glutamate receptor ionotropic, delta-2-like isoform X2 [Macrobrachium nipponense]|uniref:glutamate receptor ionotropic, delta-2-like isoform X2 n=1 Tax=Macrobrachium nipponense TaxID=159736 RepID=UPI0030C82DF6
MGQGDRHLRVAVGTWHPWSVVTVLDNGAISAKGVAVDVFETILQKMNYSHSYIQGAEGGEWGRQLLNGSWTGMIRMTMDGTWIALAVVLGISIIVGLIFNHILSEPVEDNMGHQQKRLTFRPDWIISNLLGEATLVLPTTETGRVLLMAWLIAAFILDSAYLCVLTSILAVPKVTIHVDSLEDLVSYKKIPWALERGTGLHQLAQQATTGVYKQVFDGKSDMVYRCYEAKERIKTERIAVLCQVLSMRKAINDDFTATGQCNYYIARRPIFSVSLAYAFRKRSKVIKEFDKWLTMLIESGLVLKSVQDSTANATNCMTSLKRREQATPILGFMDLAGMFLLWIGGLLVSMLVMAAEIIIFRFKLFGSK